MGSCWGSCLASRLGSCSDTNQGGSGPARRAWEERRRLGEPKRHVAAGVAGGVQDSHLRRPQLVDVPILERHIYPRDAGPVASGGGRVQRREGRQLWERGEGRRSGTGGLTGGALVRAFGRCCLHPGAAAGVGVCPHSLVCSGAHNSAVETILQLLVAAHVVPAQQRRIVSSSPFFPAYLAGRKRAPGSERTRLAAAGTGSTAAASPSCT